LKKILNVIVLTLAMNFLLVVAGSAMLLKTSHMDRDKFTAVKKLLFETSQPTTEPASTEPVATTEPADRLADLLAKASGRPAGEQVSFIRQAFDTEMAELDRKQRELADLQHQIDLARTQTATDRAKIEQGQKDLVAQQEEQSKLASDKGFQDSLELYNAMPAKQVKTIFMTLSDDTVMQYLVAMEPRAAGKIIKEFKLPEETIRIQKVLEKIRQSQAAPNPAAPAAPGAAQGLPSATPGSPQAALPQ
jgi:flagellar motility protein MotE (MotC chaperone)